MMNKGQSKSWVIYFLLWGLVVALFFPVFSILYRQRWNALDYTHAYFILPVSLGLVYWKRKKLARAFAGTEKRFGVSSLLIFIFGGLMYLFGWRQDYMVVSTFALIPFFVWICRLYLWEKGAEASSFCMDLSALSMGKRCRGFFFFLYCIYCCLFRRLLRF